MNYTSPPNPIGPYVLGIHVKHDASVAICSPDGIICAVAEERLSRIKHAWGFPVRALEAVFITSGLSPSDMGAVAFTSKRVMYGGHINTHIIDADGHWMEHKGNGKQQGGVLRSMRAFFDRNAPPFLAAVDARFADRHWSRFESLLEERGLMDEKIPHYYVAHHRAHAASAFRLSGMGDCAVFTLDGLGDGLSGTVYWGHGDGRMELVRKSSSKHSLGSFYQAATEALGFVPVDSEYKTMGLAAIGSGEREHNPFGGVVSVNDGMLHSSIEWTLRDFNAANPSKKVSNPLASVAQADDFKKVLMGMEREQFSYYVQQHCEDAMLAYARDAMRITGTRSIAAAGGVMLNVKANARIRDELAPDEFFVFPDAGDSGLAAGAAMETLYQLGALKSNASQFFSPFLGNEYHEPEIEKEIYSYAAAHGLSVMRADHGHIADKLSAGRVIGTFQGRLEMGPRALGNRSVLADPRSPATKDRINAILKGREWFVPFAPAVLASDAHRFWDGPHEYRYMTFSVNANDYAKKTVPAVVHVDGTMRPEVVTEDFNPWLFGLLAAFKEKTGVGLLLNTSFNRHGLPIVGSPEDALEHLVNGWVDGLSIGPWYVEKGE